MKVATPKNTNSSNFAYKTAVTKRFSNESCGSLEPIDRHENDYENYPFSRANVKPPSKPVRSSYSNGPENQPYSPHRMDETFQRNTCISTSLGPHHRHKRGGMDSISSHIFDISDKKDLRLRSSSSDEKSIFSSSDSGLVADVVLKRDTYTTEPTPYDHNGRASSSLRRTPLRQSCDSYNKLVEVHRQTVEKIAQGAASVRCDCSVLDDCEWEDFQMMDETIPLQVPNYHVVPVMSSKRGNRSQTYTAWVS